MPRPFYPQETDPAPTVQEAGWTIYATVLLQIQSAASFDTVCF